MLCLLRAEALAAAAPDQNQRVWVEETPKIHASDPAPSALFGNALAIDGERAVIGALQAPGAAEYTGAAYVFARSGGAWVEEQKLAAADSGMQDYFGAAVAISGNLIVIGATGNDELGTDSGAAYVFERGGTGWTPIEKLHASDTTPSIRFGGAVAVSGDTVAVGAGTPPNGAVYLYARNGGAWTETKITALDGAAEDHFGAALAFDGDSLVVGAPAAKNQGGASVGAVYVYARSGSSWSERKLFADEALVGDGLGTAVALYGDTVVAGAGPAETSRGAAVVFTRTDAGWTNQRLTSAVRGVGAYFGWSVALNAEAVIVGAPYERNVADFGGAAHVFTRSGAEWRQARIVASDPAFADYFGSAVGIGRHGLLVAAYQDDDFEGASGSLYAFQGLFANGHACIAAAECASRRCVEGVCCDGACNGVCQSCLGSKKAAGDDGTCGDIQADIDPDGECAPASCPSEATAIPASACNGAGACKVVVAAPCATGSLCVDGTCNESCATDDDCSEGAYCDTRRLCASKRANGGDCGGANQCRSGFCFDGSCCNDACTGQCEACDEPGAEGSCIAVSGEPRGDRARCSGSAPCGGACDGTDPSACVYPGPTTVCGSSCEAGLETTASCDGSGSCAGGRSRPCGAYVCGGEDACVTECESDVHCAIGYRCGDGACAPAPGGKCSDDRSASVGPDGSTLCGAYLCELSSGLCRSDCVTTAGDCARGYACDPETHVCTSADAASSADAGCGCRTARARGTGAELGLLTLLLACALRHRRARRPDQRATRVVR